MFAIIVLSCISHHASGQKENLQNAKNKLLCNVYDYQHADSATVSFLRANYPYLAAPKPQGGVFLPPIGTNSTRETVSMRFRRHPFFAFTLKEGRVDFHGVNSAGEKFETGADLWLIFDNEQDAKVAFQVLSDTLASVSKDKKITTDNDQTTADFTGDGIFRSPFRVKLILKKEATGDFTIFLPTPDRTLDPSVRQGQ